MDELRGPNIQIVLHVKDGLGFGFLRSPFIVSGSLNGYMLETDPVVPCHGPVFDAELVWEADKRRFRSLRVQNVPVKVEVFTTSTQGRKDKIGYLLLSLLGAQPCPANKIVDVKYSWHKLLGVKSEGKCCHPQLLMSLSIEDRVYTSTPRNELRMFHSNEVAYPKTYSNNTPSGKSMLLTLKEYIAESKKTVSSPDLQPKLICDEGIIQIGSGKQLFMLSFVIGALENLDLLLPDFDSTSEGHADCYITYSVFTHHVMTDRVGATVTANGVTAMFNQRTSLRLRSTLSALGRYFVQCPHLVTKVCAGDRDVGICSVDLRKLIPTDVVDDFVSKFCNAEHSLTIHERCFILRCEGATASDKGRRAFVDIEMCLKYLGIENNAKKPNNLTARSAVQLESDRKGEQIEKDGTSLANKSESCTNVGQDVGGVGYTNMAATNINRYKNASGDAVLQTNEIADMIKKMCDSFAMSQEKLYASRLKPSTSDMEVQCEPEVNGNGETGNSGGDCGRNEIDKIESKTIQVETSKCDPCMVHDGKDLVKSAIAGADRDAIMKKFVDELEDWKDKQQVLFKVQLKRKEEYHLDLLAKEWAKKRVELECKLSSGIEQCRTLAADLSRATDDFRLRGYRNTEREKKLLEAKKALETHYTAKYQELRVASQKMEDDMNHQLKIKDMRIEELELNVQQLEKRVDVLKSNIKTSEMEAESKYSGLTKDQTASLIQELRCLEEKLDSAIQSKAFFKEQWGRAVRELHLLKSSTRRQMLTQLQQDRKQLGDMGLDRIQDQDETADIRNQVDLNKLKDDFYVDLLANTPILDSRSIISSSCLNGMEALDAIKSIPSNPLNDKINELITQRDGLIRQDSPNEDQIKQLNREIRSLLLNCST